MQQGVRTGGVRRLQVHPLRKLTLFPVERCPPYATCALCDFLTSHTSVDRVLSSCAGHVLLLNMRRGATCALCDFLTSHTSVDRVLSSCAGHVLHLNMRRGDLLCVGLVMIALLTSVSNAMQSFGKFSDSPGAACTTRSQNCQSGHIQLYANKGDILATAGVCTECDKNTYTLFYMAIPVYCETQDPCPPGQSPN
jgi:hypothetical protein